MRKVLHSRVADQLIRRASQGDSDSGLDIAWHCMRCGRSEEATDYLIDGARAAVRRGAVHEAEFRLASALEQIDGPRRPEAVLVLCELLQEQARWQESLEVLKSSPEVLSTYAGQARRFTAMASWGQLTPSELNECADLVGEIVSAEFLDGATARAAAYLATRLHSSTYDVALAQKVRDAILVLEAKVWGEDDRIDIAMARIKLDFGIGMTRAQREQALGQIEHMARATKARTLPSARSYSLVSGAALLNATLGRIEEAILEQQTALEIARRLDNQNLVANCLANSAEHHGWLGNHLPQLQCAERVLQAPLVRHGTSYTIIKAAYNFALGSLMLGKPEGINYATDVARDYASPLRSDTLNQFWLFCESDFHHLLGDEKTALSRSLEALEVGNGRCLNPRLAAGLATRCSARIILEKADRGDAARQLIRSIHEIEATMELPEQVEALAAMIQVAEGKNEREELTDRLHSALRFMPMYAAKKLETLGTPVPPPLPGWTAG